MRLIRGLHNLQAMHRGGIATIGNFDGVHRGHQAIIVDAGAVARAMGVPLTVIAFEPTPAEFFSTDNAPARLTRLAEKVHALAQTAADQFLCLRFDGKLASLAPDDFVQQVLVSGLGVQHVLVGDDFRYGHKRAGDFESLTAAGKRHQFSVARMPTVSLDGERFSSSAVREALAGGNLQRARALLGRPYSMCGRIVRGQCLGRKLGYPTANIDPKRRRSPLQGIFAVRAELPDRRRFDGVASLGTRPTVAGNHELLEVHLFGFEGELYGTRMQVEFLAKLREEAHFASLDALVAQMREDELVARRVLARMA